ncbi:MAG: tetratricopeptide repeat protein [Hungatella sp.]|nr:tetratricopeptide repeat protein [Hungatella sp.]
MEQMNCWEILGIERTKNQELIREAYLRRLPEFHPEEDAKGFQMLRSAMEEAVREALDTEAGAEEEDGACGLRETDMMDSREIREFLKRVQELYQDFGRRIRPEQWKELLACDVCQDLESQKEAGWALIGFLMNRFHIPHSCFVVMDQVFGWTETREELKEHFSEGFVRYLLERIEEEDSFRYDKMPVAEDFDYDRFFEAYFELRTAIGEKERDRVEESLQAIEAMGMVHPDLTILKIRHVSMIKGMEREAWEMARQLYETDKDWRATRYWYVLTAMEAGESETRSQELEEILAGLVDKEPENPGFWQLCGRFMRSQNRLDQALQAFRRADDFSQGDWNYLQEQIADTADALSRQMEEDGCEDTWSLANLCWMGRRYDRVRELLKGTEPPEDREITWMILMAGSCHKLEEYEEALLYRQKIWDGYRPQDRPLELYMDLAEEYGLVGDREKALEIYGQAAETFSENGEIYYRQAKLLEEDGRREEAAEMCRKTLNAGFHREAFNLWLELLLDMEEYEEVTEQARRVMEQGYRPAQVLFDYARALRKLEEYQKAGEVLKELYDRTEGADIVCEEFASLYYDMDRALDALKWIEEALAKRETPRRLYMQADYLHDLDRFEEETDVYKKLQDQGYDDYYMHYRRGRALEQAERFEEAETDFRTAIEKQADYGSAWDGLGDIYQKQGRWKEAASAYEAGMELGHLQAARDLCRILKRIHEDDRAIECLKKGLKRWPEDGSLLLLYSDMLVRTKEYEEAVRCLNRYMEVKPSQTGRAYREIAMTYERAKDLDRAQEYYQKSVDLEPKNARAWRLMGKFMANERKDQEKALPYLEKAVELAPDSTYGYMKLGEVYEALGQKAEAEKCYEKALENYRREIEKDPKDCCNYEGMADVLVHLGRLDEARETAQKAISLECRVFTCSCPFCYEAYEDIAKAEEKRGNLREALTYMELAGRLASTDYYPGQIERLRKAVEA